MTTRADLTQPTTDLTGDLGYFKTLGFRLDAIYPADDPRVAVLSGHGLRLRLDRDAPGVPAALTLATDEDLSPGTSPGGTPVRVIPAEAPLVQPETTPAFHVRRLADNTPWVIGRAGMHYRDLIPDRLGGSIIASHIRIPDGGPVPDMVHYHTVGFQLIFCYRGWVDLVYEDQGPPFRLEAGNCVIQPPRIRHRVLHASDAIEVIEIGVPAEHLTTIDHDMTLPTPTHRPDREWDGQRFVHHKADDAAWVPHARQGFVCRDTTIAENTKGVAGVQVLRRGAGAPAPAAHDAEIHFCFVMEGAFRLEAEGEVPRDLVPGDAFTLPPGMRATYADPSDDVELLEVMLPGNPA